MYLVDTNVWLELLLEQQRASEVRRFLQLIDADFDKTDMGRKTPADLLDSGRI
jgi:predicted nucleic acid-binding protein